MNTKTCPGCGATKDAALFRKGRNQCKACIAAKNKDWYLRNAPHVLERTKKYRLMNSSIYSTASAKWRATHHDQAKQHKTKWREKSIKEARPGYVVDLLRRCGIRAEKDDTIVQIKQQHIFIKRDLKALTNLIKEKSHGS